MRPLQTIPTSRNLCFDISVLWHFALCTILLAVTCLSARGQDEKPGMIVIEGQLVCSVCWFEADRKATPYGSDADIDCAKDCAAKGIPPAIAVETATDFKLYLIEDGYFKKHGDTWLDYIGKRVQVSGRLRTRNNKEYVAVDQLRVLSSLAALEAQIPKAIGAEAELALKDLFGIEQKLSAYRGKIVVLNFWATWCIPCRKEMPDLAAIQNEYAALGVQVVGASGDTIAERSAVLQFIKQARINFPVWLGATTADMKRFGLGPALPGTAIIGRDGKILSVSPSVITQAQLKKQLDKLLAPEAVAMKRQIAAARPQEVEVSLVPS